MPVFSHFWRNAQTGLTDPDKLRLVGPVLQVEIGIPASLVAVLQQARHTISRPQIGMALIDTGASITGVDQSVLQQLGLSPTGITPVATPGGSVQQYVYACDIAFPGTPIPQLPFNQVLGSDLQGMEYVALIGRDVLERFQLVYNGVDGFWTLAF